MGRLYLRSCREAGVQLAQRAGAYHSAGLDLGCRWNSLRPWCGVILAAVPRALAGRAVVQLGFGAEIHVLVELCDRDFDVDFRQAKHVVAGQS
jgi:hypothetical protein